MGTTLSPSTHQGAGRLTTHVPGLDTVLDGGVIAGDTYLISGEPGTGKTTLGNQIAFAHGRDGGNVVFATLLTESHDRMLAHLDDFSFADRSMVGKRVHYMSVLNSLQEGGFEGLIQVLFDILRKHQSTLLIVDGAGAAHMLADSDLEYARFIHGLQARTALIGCTLVLLASEHEAQIAATHVDGMIQLFNTPIHARDSRWLRIAKLRGSSFRNGRHQFTITSDGISIFPRLESVYASLQPAWHQPDNRLGFGVPSLDRLVSGGFQRGSSTLIIAPPGAGKTLLGLHFLAEGAKHGEAGLLAGFNETPEALMATARGVGLDLGTDADAGPIRLIWTPPLEISPDKWAWELIRVIEEHRPQRLVVDAFNALLPLFDVPERTSAFVTALVNVLRDHNVTVLFSLETELIVGPSTSVPVQNLLSSMDNGLLLRITESGSALQRSIAVIKQRQSTPDPTIRQLHIDPDGVSVGESTADSAPQTTREI